MMSIVVLSLLLGLSLAKPYSIQNRISGGDEAAEGQFPFQIGLQTQRLTEDNNEYSAWCGGSLISDSVVITAAHCVIGGISAQIYLGAADLQNGNALSIKVKKDAFIIHENFSKNDNDIALIILPQKVTLNERIKTVNLPRKSQKDMTFEKEIGWISGWGKLGDAKGITTKLQFTRRWILPHSNCDYYYPGYFRGDLQVCVDGSHGMSSCGGDSGGPLTVVEKDESRTLVGLASYGMNVCEKGFPTVYARVTPHLEWIAEKTGIPVRE